MRLNEILNTLDLKLRNTAWKYKFWEKKEILEFRNTGKNLTEQKLNERIDEILNEVLKEGKFKPVLAGKFGLSAEDGELWKMTIDESGHPNDEIKRLEKEEARKFIHKSFHRVDNDILVSNRVVLDIEEIVDIYSERSQGNKYINISLKGTKRVVLEDDGGLEFST